MVKKGYVGITISSELSDRIDVLCKKNPEILRSRTDVVKKGVELLEDQQ